MIVEPQVIQPGALSLVPADDLPPVTRFYENTKKFSKIG